MAANPRKRDRAARVRARTVELEAAHTPMPAQMTEHTRARAATLQSEAHFRALVENSYEAITLFDAQAQVLWTTDSMTRILGYPVDEFVGHNFFEFIHAEDAPRIQGIFGDLLEHPGASATAELRALHRDGTWVWIEGIGTNLLNEPSVRAIVSNYRDISERKEAQQALHRANTELQARVLELQAQNQEITTLTLMSEALQVCLDAYEVYHVVEQYAPQLFPGDAGCVGILDHIRNEGEWVACWGIEARRADRKFLPLDCLAIRRGRVHAVQDTDHALVCHHLPEPAPHAYLCVPLLAQSEVLGVLYVAAAEPEHVQGRKEQWAVNVAAHLELTLANLRLRESLREQSIRDPLTNLYNRRYMEQALDREIVQAERTRQFIGVILLDLDYFKQFNDTYGHDAGDALLRALGNLLTRYVRHDDVACRYGGEEFALILPRVSLETAIARAEELRRAAKGLKLVYRGQTLPPVTLSLGVAGYPQHGTTEMELVHAADQALYLAKQRGRDAVVRADIPGEHESV